MYLILLNEMYNLTVGYFLFFDTSVDNVTSEAEVCCRVSLSEFALQNVFQVKIFN